MIREEQNPIPDDMRKVLRLMQISMRNNAMQHFGRIDIRTLRMLQDLDLFKDMADSIGDHVDITVLKDLSHPRRENLPPGPLIMYRTEGQPPKRVLVELPFLLFSEIPDVRKAALKCLSQMIQSDSLAVTPKTGGVLENLCKPLISDVPSEWRLAAVRVADALNDDFFIALQGARQSLEYDPVIQDRLDFYAPKVIRPAISSLDSITLHISNPENEHEQITDVIGQIIAKAQTLADVCADYYTKLGFFPLAPQYGIGEAVKHWLAAHTATDPWKEVWDWAHATAGPVPRYHACCVFVLHPELVPQGRMHDLWKEVLGVVYESARKGSDQPGHEEWALRHALARHYAYHLEAHFPDNNGAKISCFAWWISEQVAGLFTHGPEAARFFREKWVKPALEVSSSIWLGASPHIQGSPFRYMTLTGPSPWAVGLLSIMSGKLELLAPGEQSEEVRAQFHDALVHHAISSLPFPVQNSSAPTFAFECSLAETILKWAK